MNTQYDAQRELELVQIRNALIAKSDQILSWLTSSKGKSVPELAVMAMANHSDDCAQWLMESVGFEDFEDWLATLSDEDRGEFEVAILPFTLLSHNSYTHNIYEMIGDSLKGQDFRDKFDLSMVEEIRKLMKQSFVKSGGDISGALDTILLPKLVPEDGRSMLHPELYAQISALGMHNTYKDVVTCTYGGWVPDERGVRALTALANKVDPALGQRYLTHAAPQIIHFPPSQCPGMREKLTGRQDVSMDECSQRMGIVMGMIKSNLDNPQLPMLVEAVQLCPDYRRLVMRQDMSDSIRPMIEEIKTGTTSAPTCKAIANLCAALELSQYDINYLLLKLIGGHTNGKLLDLDRQPPAEGLDPIIKLAVDRSYDTIREYSAVAELTCNLLVISEPGVLMDLCAEDDVRHGFMYKLTQNPQHLRHIRAGATLDSCFSSDLGL